MICLDSSIWLEYFSGSQLGRSYSSTIEGESPVIASTLILFEVYRKISAESDEKSAEEAISIIRYNNLVIPVTEEIALRSAEISRRYRLSMADAIIYTTALHNGAELWTQDAHFEHLPGVKHFKK